MCGRFALVYENDPGVRFGTQGGGFEFVKSTNIAPGSRVPVVTDQSGKKSVSLMTWGLVPFWAREKRGTTLINARIESAAKPTFTQSFAKRRCLVPASGFYEWQKRGDSKIPYLFRLTNEELFGLAGIFEEEQDAGGKVQHSFALVTTKANELMAPIHDRMPVIVPRRLEDEWLGEEKIEALLPVLSSYPAAEMQRTELVKE